MRKLFAVILLIVCAGYYTNAQVLISPLESNPQVQRESVKIKKELKSKAVAAPVVLPFFDDFSNSSVYPDSKRWCDRYAFVNNRFGVNPVTIGIVTLDALNDTGALYLNAQVNSFPADTLTSNSIRLDSLFSPSPNPIRKQDSIYFSFYFQPGGGLGFPWSRIGDMPEAEDSLVLEFYNSKTATWNHIWSTAGFSLDTLYKYDSVYFKQVMIPILDSASYYTNDFRFRFRNYCSLGNNLIPSWQSNCDQWHLDYIYLNRARNLKDTTYLDLSFVDQAPSFLKEYQAMPARQFQSSDVAASFSQKLTNLYNDTLSSQYFYWIFDQNGTQVHFENRGNENILPYIQSGYQSIANHSTPPITYAFPGVSGTEQNFEIRHVFQRPNVSDIHPSNDTVRFTQVFSNYFAYDDGTAENGFGLTPAGSKLACQFKLNNPDTLTAVQMFFNQTSANANQKYFYLTVWNDNGSGKPGDTLYRMHLVQPEFEPEINGFHTYVLERPLLVNGTIYVGWIQNTSDNLNLGFDRNTNSNSHIFYNSTGTWENTIYTGSLMLRPYFGSNLPVGIEHVDPKNIQVKIFPNPLNSSVLHIQSDVELNEYDKIIISDLTGKTIINQFYTSELNAEILKDGIYIVRILTHNGSIIQTQKLVVIK